MNQEYEMLAGRKIGFLNGPGRLIIFWLILIGLGVTIYAEPLSTLAVSVLQRHDSSHGLFVPFIAAYLVWLKYDKIKGIRHQADLPAGAALVLAGFALFYLGRSGPGIVLPVLSYLLVAGGLILMFFGRPLFKQVSFPVFFLAAMIPLPEAAYNQIAEWMRQAATYSAVMLLRPFDFPFHREGFDIYLPNINLYVAYSCSGIRYLLSYLAFGLAYAFRFKQSNKVRLLVVAAAVPLAVAGAVMRLWVIFMTAHYIGPIMVERRPHELLSWSVFAVFLGVAVGLDRYVSRKRSRLKGNLPPR